MLSLKLRPRAHLKARSSAVKARLSNAFRFERLAVAGLMLTLCAQPGLVNAQSNSKGTTRYFGGASFESIPSALSADSGYSDTAIPISIETAPLEEEDFFRSFDSFMEADKNLNDLHQTYLRALIPYNTYTNFSVHARDTHQLRYFSWEREMAVREQMAHNLRNYLLIKGIPKFLETREETKGLGQKYASVVGQTEKLTKVNIKMIINLDLE